MTKIHDAGRSAIESEGRASRGQHGDEYQRRGGVPAGDMRCCALPVALALPGLSLKTGGGLELLVQDPGRGTVSVCGLL